MDWILDLFDTTDFVPRMQCGSWPDTMAYAYVTCQIAFALAYALIPGALILFWREKRAAIPYPFVLPMFAAFILLCGLSHGLDAVMFFWPAYRLLLAVLVAGAAVSLASAAAFLPVARWVARMRTPKEYFEVVSRLEANLHKEEDVCERLKLLVSSLEAREVWLRSQVVGGFAGDDVIRLSELQALLRQAREAKRMLGIECPNGGAA